VRSGDRACACTCDGRTARVRTVWDSESGRRTRLVDRRQSAVDTGEHDGLDGRVRLRNFSLVARPDRWRGGHAVDRVEAGCNRNTPRDARCRSRRHERENCCVSGGRVGEDGRGWKNGDGFGVSDRGNCVLARDESCHCWPSQQRRDDNAC
jgi:hypothetical protein